jgi:hypothetical protein
MYGRGGAPLGLVAVRDALRVAATKLHNPE